MSPSVGDLQLSWLETFVAVQQTGSFTAAARRVRRAQPRVSEQIALLERKLGARLLVRGHGQTMLTEVGQRFLPFALAALQELQAGIAATSPPHGAIHGPVTIASYPGASALVLAPFIKAFHDRHPEARVELRDLIGQDLASSVLNGEVDAAIQVGPPSRRDRALSARLLYREPIVCLVPSGHPLSNAQRLAPCQLDRQPIIMTSAFTSDGGRYQSLLGREQIQPAEETLVGQPTTVAALAAAGLGIGVLPALAAQLTNLGDQASIVAVPDPAWSQDVYLLTNRARAAPPTVATFVRELIAAPLRPPLTTPRDT